MDFGFSCYILFLFLLLFKWCLIWNGWISPKFGSVPTQSFVLKHTTILLILLPNKSSHTWLDIPREARELKIRRKIFFIQTILSFLSLYNNNKKIRKYINNKHAQCYLIVFNLIFNILTVYLKYLSTSFHYQDRRILALIFYFNSILD